MELAESIAKEHESIAQKYNSMPEEERLKNMAMYNQCNRLEFKFYSLRDVLCFKEGNLSIELPDGIDYPITSVQEKGVKKTFENKEM